MHSPTLYTYTLSLHDALPISVGGISGVVTGSQKYELNGTPGNSNAAFMGGWCYIFAAAGTYDISVQFKSSSGSVRSEEHTSELQSLTNLVCRLLLEKKNKTNK